MIDALDDGGRFEEESASLGETPAECSGSNVIDLAKMMPTPLFDPWAEAILPAFPIDTLPPIVGRFVASQSRLIGSDPSALTMAAIAGLGAAIDHRFRLRLMRHGDWAASPRLWVLLCGDPSTKKTPIIDAATRHLEQAQAEAWKQWETDVAELKRAAKSAGGDLHQEDLPEKPPRFVIGDATTEALGEMLSRQSRGVLAKRDELTGWLASMDRYVTKGGADRAFWLQAYNGGPYFVDRISRSYRYIENLSISVIGGIQPAKLAELKDQTSDGLLQRFIPVLVQGAKMPIDEPTGNAEAAFGRLVSRLVRLEPSQLAFDDAAVLQFASVRKDIFDLEQASGGLASGFQAFVGKLSGMIGTIALILHLARDPVHGPERPVGPDEVTRAAYIANHFLVPHAMQFYRKNEATTDCDRLQKIASFILTSGKDRIIPSDLTGSVACCRGASLSKIHDFVSPLIAADWLAPVGGDVICKAWHVLPEVKKQFAGRRDIERDQKAVLKKLMNGGR